MFSFRKRAGLAILATAALAVSLAAPASGEPAAHIDVERTGSITLNKMQAPQVPGDPASGLPQGVPGPAIPGVEFTLQRLVTFDGVAVDLTTVAGWDAAQAFWAADPRPEPAGLELEQVSVQVTNNEGVAVFSALPLGIFLVTETATPPGVIAADPFWVSIPMSHPSDDGTWLYDVVVYPKNEVEKGGEKSILDAGDVYGPTDAVTWSLRVEIPPINLFTHFQITDVLDDRLVLAGAPLDAVSVFIGDESENPLPFDLTPGVDFVVTHTRTPVSDNPARFAPRDFDGDGYVYVVTVAFTEPGLRVLEAAAIGEANAHVVVRIDTYVTEAGHIVNYAWTVINDSEFYLGYAETRWGRIEIEKVSEANGRPLGGAVFELFATRGDAWLDEDASRVSLGLMDPTDADGRAVSAVLRYTDFADGAACFPGQVGSSADDGECRWYFWLVEVEAPLGHQLDATPIRIVLNSQTGVEVITNAQLRGFELPMTGGAGTLAFTVGGILVLAVAAVVGLRSRKRS